jgi:RNA polymerase sigma factor (sigma-70 family)
MDVTTQFETHRRQLRATAYRMLGSVADVDDAVQETWLRLQRADVSGVVDLESWLRTVLSRLCLDMLRTRASRREEPLLETDRVDSADPEAAVELVEDVGRAMLVVLSRLGPAERVAFVLHDLFAVPFDEIAPIVSRTPVATKKLASRARLRVRGAAMPDVADQRKVVAAFLAAAREGDLPGLVAVLAPDVVRRADPAALPAGRPTVAQGVDVVARDVLVFGRRARFADLVLVNGSVGAVVAPGGRLRLVVTFEVRDGLVAAYEVIADPDRLRSLALAVLT